MIRYRFWQSDATFARLWQVPAGHKGTEGSKDGKGGLFDPLGIDSLIAHRFQELFHRLVIAVEVEEGKAPFEVTELLHS